MDKQLSVLNCTTNSYC